MCDLLWSDPDDRCGWGISPRGAGYTFGQVCIFLPLALQFCLIKFRDLLKLMLCLIRTYLNNSIIRMG